MNPLLYIALPPFFYGIAVQQMFELVYSLLPPGPWQRYQKPFSKAWALIIGSASTAAAIGLHVTIQAPAFPEILLGGFLTAASAELTNALLKFLVYAKEARKAAAADALSTTGSISLEGLSRK